MATDRVEDPHPVDRHVGLRIRLRRKELRLTQEKLAEALGLTFQQVQKYELGTNRVSASRLFEVSVLLRVPPDYFFSGLDPAAASRPASAEGLAVAELLASPAGSDLAFAFIRLPIEQQRELLGLIQAIVAGEPSA
jgi:transcriptional regulator with XRE-family HTH domain